MCRPELRIGPIPSLCAGFDATAAVRFGLPDQVGVGKSYFGFSTIFSLKLARVASTSSPCFGFMAEPCFYGFSFYYFDFSVFSGFGFFGS